MNINRPEDIDITKIAYNDRIYLTYSEKRSYSTESGKFKLINLNNMLDLKKQREVFFHEWCHLLRHYGNQYRRMPKAFKELQEWDAEHFTRYAAIPFHMLKYIDWKSQTLVQDMSKTFCISEEICQQRVDHIKRNKQVNSNLRKRTISHIL